MTPVRQKLLMRLLAKWQTTCENAAIDKYRK